MLCMCLGLQCMSHLSWADHVFRPKIMSGGTAGGVHLYTRWKSSWCIDGHRAADSLAFWRCRAVWVPEGHERHKEPVAPSLRGQPQCAGAAGEHGGGGRAHQDLLPLVPAVARRRAPRLDHPWPLQGTRFPLISAAHTRVLCLDIGRRCCSGDDPWDAPHHSCTPFACLRSLLVKQSHFLMRHAVAG